MQPQSMQETIDEITKLADARGDSFNVKVMRRNSITDLMPELWVQFNGVTARQISDKEIWLVPLMNQGGGVFDLIAYHSSEPMKPIGAPLRMVSDALKRDPPALEIIDSKAWIGPKNCVFPQRKVANEVTSVGVSVSNSNGNGNSVNTNFTPGQFKREIEVTNGMANSNSATEKRLIDTLTSLESRESALREREKKLELQSMIEPLKRETDELKRALVDADRRHQEVLNELRNTRTSISTEPKEDVVDKISKLAGALGLGNVITSMMEKSETRNRELIKSIQDSSDKNVAMIKETVERLSNKNDGMTEVTSKMGEVMSTMANMLVQTAHQMKTLQPSVEEPSALVTFAEALSRPLDKIASAYLLDRQRQAKTAGVKGIETKELPPAGKNAPEVSPEQIPNLMEIGQRIMNYADPKSVVDFFFDKYREEDLQTALRDTDPPGDPEVLLESLLEEWIAAEPRNKEYIERLKVALKEGAKARGYIEKTANGALPNEKKDETPRAVENQKEPAKA